MICCAIVLPRGADGADDEVIPTTELPPFEVRAMRDSRSLEEVPAAFSLIPLEVIQQGTQQLSLEESL